VRNIAAASRWRSLEPAAVHPAAGPASAGPSLRSLETRGEPDAQGRAEELLDPGVQRSEDAIELVLADRLVGQLADQEDGVLLADGEGGAVELEVPPQEVHVELLVVLLR